MERAIQELYHCLTSQSIPIDSIEVEVVVPDFDAESRLEAATIPKLSAANANS
jgi:hypothetical protein